MIQSHQTSNRILSIAGILSHKIYDNLKPICLICRASSVTKLKQCLLDNQLILRTDHKPLICIFGEEKWLLTMASTYRVGIKGASSESSDGVSRMPQTNFIGDY